LYFYQVTAYYYTYNAAMLQTQRSESDTLTLTLRFIPHLRLSSRIAELNND